MDEGRTDILGSGGRVLVGMLQPLVPIFVQKCNGHNFPLIGKLLYAFTPSFGSMDEGRTDILGSGGMVLVGLLHSLWFQYLSRSALEV
jgi:hypothetical protein